MEVYPMLIALQKLTRLIRYHEKTTKATSLK